MQLQKHTDGGLSEELTLQHSGKVWKHLRSSAGKSDVCEGLFGLALGWSYVRQSRTASYSKVFVGSGFQILSHYMFPHDCVHEDMHCALVHSTAHANTSHGGYRSNQNCTGLVFYTETH